MAEEDWWPLDFFTEFRPRYSRGTAGGRPGFSYQYQTYAVDRGRIIPKLLGNNSLKPELATEQEYGIDMMVADRYRIQLNYVDLEVKDQLLLVPLSSALGFESQWRNAGTVASTTWEASLEAALCGASGPGLDGSPQPRPHPPGDHRAQRASVRVPRPASAHDGAGR